VKFKLLTTSIFAASLVLGCAQAENKTEKLAETMEGTENVVQSGVDISAAPSGTYKSEPGHSHLAFTYSHHGYSKQIMHWDEMEAKLDLDSANPENSFLMVTIPVSSIDSGLEAFDKHLLSADFFDVDNHPAITFKSTSMEQGVTGTGRVTGDLTIMGVTKPLTLDVTLNKIGKKFRTGEDLFGVSARGSVTRADFGLDKYGPTANVVDLMIEVEFEKVE